MKKDMHNRSNKKQKGQQQKAGSGEEVLETDEVLHCDEDLTVLKLEFILVSKIYTLHSSYTTSLF